jgi:hypothetical protein
MKDKKVLVPKEIQINEICLRLVFSPYHIDSKGKLRKEALLPPLGRNDISLFRQSYITKEKIDELGFQMSNDKKTFKAVASIKRLWVLENNNWAGNEHLSISADIYYSPMNKGKYIDENIDVYVNDKNVDMPFHADMRYNCKLDSTVQTQLRKYASHLIKSMGIVSMVH